MRTWKPDTCDCKVEELYNGTQIIGMGQVLNKCPAHQSIPDNELYAVIYTNPDSEQKRKNLFHGHLLDNPKLAKLVTKPDGQEVREFNSGISYEWSFSGTGKDRILNVNIKNNNLSANEKKALKDFADANFGNGKIEIS